MNLKKYREIITYVVFGVLTTATDWIVYTILWKLGMDYKISTAISWFAAVMFAFITNRTFVFLSKTKGVEIIKECLKFFSSRLTSGITNMILMIVFVDIFMINEFVSKAVLSVIVLVMNYLLSKFIVFKKNGLD